MNDQEKAERYEECTLAGIEAMGEFEGPGFDGMDITVSAAMAFATSAAVVGMSRDDALRMVARAWAAIGHDGISAAKTERAPRYEREPDDYEDAPYVCPGCHAVGGERCAPGCIDDEIESERRHSIETGDYDRPDEDEAE